MKRMIRRGGTHAGATRSGLSAGPRRPHPWRGRLPSAALLLCAVLVLGGCATKRDLKHVRDEMIALQLQQDSLFAALAEAVAANLQRQEELIMRVRGDLGTQLLQMEQQLVMIQELTGQSQRRLAELRQQLDSRSQDLATPPPAATTPAQPTQPAAGAATAEQLYTIGVQQLQQNAPQTARRAFEQIVREHTTHERAPDAQYNIGETYVLEQQYDRALREFERVMELFPNSARVPTALYRAGVIAEERGNTSRAREYFQRVVNNYPRSDERQMAEDRLRRLRPN